MDISKISVIGSGQMGAGIAQVCATSNLEVILYDISQDSLKKAKSVIDKSLDKFVEKEKITSEEKSSTLKRINFSNQLKDSENADLVVEAIIEDIDIKLKLFSELDKLCKKEAILASNTSSISITKIASATKRPEKVIGMHYMNPVPLMKLVEIIRGLQTSDQTYNTIKTLTDKISKTPVTANMDYPGFIVNRILIPMLNEAVYALMDGVASVEDIDQAMKLGTNQPMGPLQLADFVGLDTCLSICQIFHKEFGDDKYRPCPLLVKYVEAGWLGKKTGRGFYQY